MRACASAVKKLMMSDGMRTGPLELSMHVAVAIGSRRSRGRPIFKARWQPTAQVQMPIAKTFFSPRFGAVADKFRCARG